MNELDLAVLRKELTDFNLKPGDVGTIVLVHDGGAAYEVEFQTKGGRTLAVVTLDAKEVRPFKADDLMHVRSV